MLICLFGFVYFLPFCSVDHVIVPVVVGGEGERGSSAQFLLTHPLLNSPKLTTQFCWYCSILVDPPSSSSLVVWLRLFLSEIPPVKRALFASNQSQIERTACLFVLCFEMYQVKDFLYLLIFRFIVIFMHVSRLQGYFYLLYSFSIFVLLKRFFFGGGGKGSSRQFIPFPRPSASIFQFFKVKREFWLF